MDCCRDRLKGTAVQILQADQTWFTCKSITYVESGDDIIDVDMNVETNAVRLIDSEPQDNEGIEMNIAELEMYTSPGK